MSRWELRPHVVLDREYDGTTSTLRAARSDMVACLSDQDIDEDLRERAELVLSELASNAVQASPGNPYKLRLSLDADGTLVMALTSRAHNGGGPPPQGSWGPSAVLAPSGRGLMIVDELSDRVNVERPAEDTVVVTATLR
jgi:anti-sigma regulatory factor (Ser/Thr protein kinase)